MRNRMNFGGRCRVAQARKRDVSGWGDEGGVLTDEDEPVSVDLEYRLVRSVLEYVVSDGKKRSASERVTKTKDRPASDLSFTSLYY